MEEAEEASLDAGQQLAFSIAVGGANLFLTGGPGTGKSFTLRKIIGALKERHGASGVLVTAPTGVAALIAEGQTLHSKRGSMSNAEGVVVLAGVGARHRSPPPQSRPIRYFAHHAHPIHTLSTPYPHPVHTLSTRRPGPGVPHGTTEAFGNMRGKTSAEFWRKVRCLVIDEISMVDAEFLDWHSSTVSVPP